MDTQKPNRTALPLFQNNTHVKTDTLFLDISRYNSGDEIMLTDGKPQLDHLALKASGNWRTWQRENYTKMFKENEVPSLINFFEV